MSILAATVTTVKIGTLQVQGLMDENGDFAIAMPQMVDLDLVPPNRSAKQLKALVGENIILAQYKTALSSKPVNAIPLDSFPKLIFALAQKGNHKAVEMWNTINPDMPVLPAKAAKKQQGIESRMEDFAMDLYRDFNPQRQVKTRFGVADVVHDHGVVEIKEYRSIRSAHTAMGQAMTYGSILNKQPEVMLFNVDESDTARIVEMFTAVGMLVWMYTKEDTQKALNRKLWSPTVSNATDIQFQISKLSH